MRRLYSASTHSHCWTKPVARSSKPSGSESKILGSFHEGRGNERAVEQTRARDSDGERGIHCCRYSGESQGFGTVSRNRVFYIFMAVKVVVLDGVATVKAFHVPKFRPVPEKRGQYW